MTIADMILAGGLIYLCLAARFRKPETNNDFSCRSCSYCRGCRDCNKN